MESKILYFDDKYGLGLKLLTLSLLLTTQEAFVDSVDQDQTAQNVQSDLWSTLSTFLS